MKAWKKIGLPLLLLMVCGLVFPPMPGAEEEGEMAALRLAGICETCGDNPDCDSNNCGVASDGTRKCIPIGATTYECAVGSDSCFIDVADLLGQSAVRYKTNLH